MEGNTLRSTGSGWELCKTSRRKEVKEHMMRLKRKFVVTHSKMEKKRWGIIGLRRAKSQGKVGKDAAGENNPGDRKGKKENLFLLQWRSQWGKR